MASLTKKHKTECQVIFMMLVISLLLKQTDNEAKVTEENPAVTQCTALMDDLLARSDEKTRNLMIKKIDKARVRFTKKISEVSTVDGLIGSLRVLTSGFVKYRPGTRLGYIIQTFKTNLENMETMLPFNEVIVSDYEEEFKKAVRKMG